MQSRSSRAASRSPPLVIASRGEGLGARPCATDEQLVGGGQGGCALPSRKRGVRCRARGVRAGRRERAWGSGGRKWRARGEDPTGGLWGHGTRGGAHVEHAVHPDSDRDAGRVEAQRLVEVRRALPRSKAGLAMRAEVCRPESRGARARGAVAGASSVHVEDQRLGGWGAGHARRSAPRTWSACS